MQVFVMIDDPMIRRNRLRLVIDPISQRRQRVHSGWRRKDRFINFKSLRAFFSFFSSVEVMHSEKKKWPPGDTYEHWGTQSWYCICKIHQSLVGSQLLYYQEFFWKSLHLLSGKMAGMKCFWFRFKLKLQLVWSDKGRLVFLLYPTRIFKSLV